MWHVYSTWIMCYVLTTYNIISLVVQTQWNGWQNYFLIIYWCTIPSITITEWTEQSQMFQEKWCLELKMTCQLITLGLCCIFPILMRNSVFELHYHMSHNRVTEKNSDGFQHHWLESSAPWGEAVIQHF